MKNSKNIFRALVCLLVLLMGFAMISCDQVNDEPQPIPAPNTQLVPLFDESTDMDADLYTAVTSRIDTRLFAQLLERAIEARPELMEQLSGQTAYTIMAPNDEAMKKFFGDDDPEDLSLEVAYLIVSFHIVKDGLPYTKSMEGDYQTLMGELLAIQAISNVFVIENSARFVVVNDFCSNGYIHVINEVLNP